MSRVKSVETWIISALALKLLNYCEYKVVIVLKGLQSFATFQKRFLFAADFYSSSSAINMSSF